MSKLGTGAVALCIAVAGVTTLWPNLVPYAPGEHPRLGESTMAQRTLSVPPQMSEPPHRTVTRDDALRAAAVEVNKAVPRMLDEVTRLDGAVIEGDLFAYQFTILVPHLTTKRFEQLAASVRSQAVPVYCEGAMKNIRDLNARIAYRYRTSKGAQIGEIVITSHDCIK